MRKQTLYSIGAIVLLLAIAGSFYFINLGKLPFEDYDEATYASVLKSSFDRGDFLSFQYFGNNWFEKPPLQFWLMAASSKVFGFNEFALRFPSAIFGLISILFAYLIVWEITKDRASAFWAGLFATLMPLFMAAARNVRMDIPVSAMILSAVYFFLLGLRKPAYLIGIGISIGLGIMFKSVIGLLALPIILIWALTFKRWQWLKNRFPYIGAVASLIIVAPWHIYESIKFGGAFWKDYLGYHIFERFSQNILGSKITIGYYLATLWERSEPILPVIILGTILLAILYFAKKREFLRAPTASLLSALFIFIIFSISKTKLITYYTPLYPFAAIFFGLIYNALKNIFPAQKWIFIGMMVFLAIPAASSTLRAFLSKPIYVTDSALDEKAIGLYLSENDKNTPINLFNWNDHNTIRYYSGMMTETIQFNSSNLPNPPFWLILPTELLSENEFIKSFPMPYSGKYLTLVYFENE